MKKYRIGIDMRMMKPFSTGIGNHYIFLIKELIKNFPDREYIIILSKRGEGYVKKNLNGLNVTYVVVNINGGSFKQYFLSLYLYKKYADLRLDTLITDIWSSFVFMPHPFILMIYDLIGFNNIIRVSLKQRLFDFVMYRLIAHLSDRIIASSKAVKNDVIKFLKTDEKKIAVVMPSVGDEYREDISEEFFSEVMNKYSLHGNYIVYIGNRRSHKNIIGGLKIFDEYVRHYKDEDLQFVLIGGFDTERTVKKDTLIKYIKDNYPLINDKIRILGRVDSSKEVKAILTGAISLLHPSLFEGYGLTPLEAMNSGTVVIASNIPSIAEVVQDAGMLINPDDIKSSIEAIRSIMTLEGKENNLRNEYIVKGLKRAKEITWKQASFDLNKAIEITLTK